MTSELRFQSEPVVVKALSRAGEALNNLIQQAGPDELADINEVVISINALVSQIADLRPN